MLFAEDFFELFEEPLLVAEDTFEFLDDSVKLDALWLLRDDFESDSSFERDFDEDDLVLALMRDLLEFDRKTDDEDFELDDLKLDFELSLKFVLALLADISLVDGVDFLSGFGSTELSLSDESESLSEALFELLDEVLEVMSFVNLCE